MNENNAFAISSGDIPSGDALIFEFGIRLDKECIPAVSDQITLSRRLYNNIVDITRSTVESLYSFVVAKAGDEAIQAQATIEALTDAFKAAKAAADEPTMKRIALERREQWRVLSGLLKGARKEHRTEIQERFLSQIGRNSSCPTYQLRSKAVGDGLGWGTANAVLDAGLQAFKKSFALGKAPRFSAGAEIDQDCLTLQFTAAGGVAADVMLSGKQSDFILLPSGGCGPRKYGEFKFRLGAAKDGAYATGTWQYHRPLPDGASIALARLVRRRVGPHYKWAIQLLVKPKTPILENVGQRSPLVTVHFGWAADVDGRRIAAITDSADPGNAETVALPLSVEAGLNRSSEIQSMRDSKRDAIVPKVRQIEIPDGAAEALTELMGKLRHTRPQDVSSNRLHFLCRLLREENLLPDWLEAWRKEDRMDWQDQVHIARRARNVRKTFYRELAINLGRKYDTIAIESLDLADAALKVNEENGEKSDFAKKARAGRVVAALYEFESAIRWATTKTGAALLEITGPTASVCSICGGAMDAAPEDHQTLHCHACGAVLDRKQNGAAVAWQSVNSQREDAVTNFWLELRAGEEAKKEKKAEKLSKMADGRRVAARTRSDGFNGAGSHLSNTAVCEANAGL